MTDPTPTRAGYSVHVEDYADMLRSLSAEIQALRDRAEAAERAEAAAWNDAIEAAEAAYAHGFAAIRALRRAAPTEDRT